MKLLVAPIVQCAECFANFDGIIKKVGGFVRFTHPSKEYYPCSQNNQFFDVPLSKFEIESEQILLTRGGNDSSEFAWQYPDGTIEKIEA